MLGPPGDFGFHPRRRELGHEFGDDARDGLLALGPLLGDPLGDVAVRVGVEIPQCEILKIPLHAPNAQAVRDRRVDFDRLFGDRELLGRRQRGQGAHVMQPVGQLDDDDPDVLGHRQEHFAQVFDLRVLFGLVRDAGQLRDTVDQGRDLGAEAVGDLFARDHGVFDDVVQERRRDRRAVHLEIRQDVGHRERMHHVRLAGGPQLPLVGRVG